MSTRLKCVHEIALTAEPTGLGAPSCHIVALARWKRGCGTKGGHLTSPGYRPSFDTFLTLASESEQRRNSRRHQRPRISVLYIEMHKC